MASKSGEFNIKTAIGTLRDVSGTIASKYYFTGEKLEKAGTYRFTIFDGTLTTCCEDTPSWKFKVSRSDIYIEQYAFMKGASFRIKDIPVLYLPYWVIPIKTKRATGFLMPDIGSSSKDGFFINNSFFWAISNHQDATVYLDYLEKKGVREGLEYRYIFSKKSSGSFSGSYLKESDTKRDFYKINFDHNQLFPNDVQGVAKIDILSGANQDKEYEDDTALRTRRQTDSYARITKNWSSRSLQILGRKRESTESGYNEIYTQLPEIAFVNQKERIGGSRFFFSMDSFFTSFRNEKAAGKIEVERADLHPKITYTFDKFPWLTLTPTVGLMETYYSRGINKAEGFTRDLYDIELKMEGPKFFRIFDTVPLNKGGLPPNASIGGEGVVLKHIIEPRVVYSYIPDIDKGDRDRIIQIDSIDALSPKNIVSYFLTNRVLRKGSGNSNPQAHEIIRLEISQQYDITEASRSDSSPRHPFSDLRFDLDTHIINPLILNFDTAYDVYESTLNTANLDAGVKYRLPFPLIQKEKREGEVYLTAERRYTRKPESTFITGIAGINMMNNLSLQYSARYDELNKKVLENDYSITYSSGCWETSFDIVNRKYFTNGEERDEIKFFFLVTLKDVASIGKRGNLGLIQRKI
jgi:LPS-assembly protein